MIAFTKVQREQRDRIITIKQTFGTEAGRSTLLELMNRFHVLHPHKGDSYSEGQRSVVLWLMKEANVKLEDFDKLMRGET